MGNIERICNYTEDNTLYQPVVSLSYIDMVNEDDDMYYREVKKNNRDLAIDILLNEKDESEWENRDSIPTLAKKGSISTMSMQLFSVTTRALQFTGYKDLEIEIFNKLEILTKGQQVLKSGLNFNMGIPSINDTESFSRKIISKVMGCSNLIAVDSGKGMANTVIIGTNIMEYLNSQLLINFGIDLIVSSFIDPDKIIVMRIDKNIGVGLNVVFKPNDNVYYLVETPKSWEKVIKWFYIK